MGACGSSNNSQKKHTANKKTNNQKGKNIDSKVNNKSATKKNDVKKESTSINNIKDLVKKEEVVVENKPAKKVIDAVNDNKTKIVEEVKTVKNTVVVETKDVVDAKDIALNIAQDNTFNNKVENLKEPVFDTTYIKNNASKYKSAVVVSKKNLVSLDNNFVNKNLPDINYSAKKLTKYFRDQDKYYGTDEFTDSYFPPTLNSIFGLDENDVPFDKYDCRRHDAESNFQIDRDDIVWLRPREIYGPDFALFEGKIEFDDVRQGSLGNCYFMASISSLTECPQIVAEIFRQHKVQSNGRYEICMKLDGEWNVVIIDDLIPCSKKTRKPIFAKSKGNELWAILLEKAWAKVNGGYINTVAGMASEVIECLVNFPYEYNEVASAAQDIEYKEALWRKIMEASANDYIMTTAIPVREGAKKIGLIECHEYTLIEGKELNYKGKTLRLCKIRNPWGSIRYTGDWSEFYSEWNDYLKTQLNYHDVYDNDGEFYISYDSFINYFADIDICKIEDRLCMKQSSISYNDLARNNYNSAPKVFELEVHEECNFNVTIFKPYYRFVRDLPTDWTIHQQLLIAKCNSNNNMEFTNFLGNCEAQNDCHIGAKLTPGKYYIVAFVDFQTAYVDDALMDENILYKLKHNVNFCCSEFFDLHEIGYDYNMSMVYKMILSYNNSFRPEYIEKQLLTRSQNNFENSEFYYLYIKNTLAAPIELKINYDNKLLRDWYSEYVQYNHNTKEVSVVLDVDQEYIGVFTPINIYQPHGMKFSYKCRKANNRCLETVLPKLIYIEPFYSDKLDLNKYSWIYKKTEVNYDHILEKIDVTEAQFKHLKSYYPSEVEDILSIPKLDDHDTLNLKVEDKRNFEDDGSCWYIGEWISKDSCLSMHGRGMLYMNGIIYVGQFLNHEMTGVGKRYNEDGSIISGNFIKFNPVGKCTYTHNDGRVELKDYK